jgi:hypothetical protein
MTRTNTDMTSTETRPKQFDLQGPNVELHYSAKGSSGEPALAGNVSGLTVACSGDDIDMHESPIGILLVVTTLLSDRAGRRRRFALLIPHLRAGKGVHELTTLGIFITDHDTEVSNEGREVLTSYAAVTLAGTVQRS